MACFSRKLSLLLATVGLGRCMGAQVMNDCQQHTVDFILLAGNPLMAQIEDDIARNLAQVGVTVNTRLLEKLEFNEAMQSGDFNLCFTETWGPPYDPHSFATGWFREGNEAHFAAMEGMEPPMTKAQMQQMVTSVLRVENEATRRNQWRTILQEMHQQAISNPMWSRQMPAIWNRRLSNYQAGPQQFDYPMHTINVVSGSTTIRVAPGANTGMFCCIGEMGPHSYTPNEFFIQNWVYEGLVSYGPDGVIMPQLATSWTVADLPSGKVEWTFNLRPGVTFHDGTPCDCSAIKMTFDHVLQPPLNTLDWHGWYQLPLVLETTQCTDSSTLVITLTEFYYPFIQELSLIRPIRVLSPESYVNGPSTDPILNNSCRTSWGNPTSSHAPGAEVHCSGVRSYAGTGPWIYEPENTVFYNDGSISEVHLRANPNWWGTRGNVERIHVIHYADNSAVEAAMLDETLDMVVGGGVLLPSQVKTFAEQRTDKFETIRGPPLMNQIMVLNANKAPTDDIAFRRLIMHAVDKASIIDAEMPGMAQVADSLYPKDAPYCNVDLTPRWDYDFEKAELLNCPAPAVTVTVTGEPVVMASSSDDDDDTALILGLCLGLGIPLLIGSACAAFFIGKKSGYKELGGKEERKTKGSPDVVGNTA